MRSEAAEALSSLAAAVDGVRRCSGLGLEGEELTEFLRGVFQLSNRLESAFTSLVGELDRSERERLHGEHTCMAWLREELHLTDGAAYGRVRLARTLPSRPETASAFDRGEIGYQHAVAVTRTLDKIVAGGTEAEVAETLLLEQALACTSRELEDFGKDLRHRLNPREVASEEDRAHEHRWFDIRQRWDGSYEFSGHAGVEQGARLQTAVEGVLGKRAKDDHRKAGQRRMDGLDELARRALDSGELPTRAGQKPHLVVSATLETLRGDPGSAAALLNWKTPISGEMLRRIASDAELTAMLVDEKGNPLWLGRRRRTASDKQFQALIHRDRRCRWPGCRRDADHCQGHHRFPWARGGGTNIDELALFCPLHHALWSQGYRPKRLPDGRVITVPPGEAPDLWFGPAVAERPPPVDPVGP